MAGPTQFQHPSGVIPQEIVDMVSDALIGQSAELSQATLTTFFRCYGDVRPTPDVLELLA
ncbi:MAG TPA: hypothetical protein VFI74_04955 [Candidatus Saccharimonadales bacterium]|nr:hypothetical protein [Candidatus Saccharimonadales bacterium]